MITNDFLFKITEKVLANPSFSSGDIYNSVMSQESSKNKKELNFVDFKAIIEYIDTVKQNKNAHFLEKMYSELKK